MNFFNYLSLLNDRENQLDSLVCNALQIAMYGHQNQKDKGGTPYICHVLAVALKQKTIDGVVCGLLHDVVEDTYYTFDGLQELGIPSHIIEALKLLTKKKGYSYEEYIKKIKTNELATTVKIADLEHNMDLSRISEKTYKDEARREKYRQALEYLMDKDEYLYKCLREDLRIMLSKTIQEDSLDIIIEKIISDVIKDIKKSETWKKTWSYGTNDLKSAIAKVLVKDISKEKTKNK